MELPLHPALVHVPVGMAFLFLPLFIVLWFGISKWAWPKSLLWLYAGMVVITNAFAYVAKSYGEADWGTVEKFVPKEALEAHAHAGDRYFYIYIALAIVSLIAAYGKILPIVFRGATVLVSLLLLIQSYITGHSGGQLVYEYGAVQGHQAKQSPKQPESVPPPAGLNQAP